MGNGQFSERVVFQGAGLKSEPWDSFLGAMKIWFLQLAASLPPPHPSISQVSLKQVFRRYALRFSLPVSFTGFAWAMHEPAKQDGLRFRPGPILGKNENELRDQTEVKDFLQHQ